jgi:hypothetical protein
LQNRLAQLSVESPAGTWRQLLQVGLSSQIAAFICLALILTAGIGKLLLEHFKLNGRNPAAMSAIGVERGEIPNHSLTPGATRAVTIHEVCAMPHEQVIREVPKSLRLQVFQKYGISNPASGDYEIDYLITPGLGGAEDIHNLWPEPSESATWNAHVKDALEEHLHHMVCAGKLDLPTAQRDIATDWIAAYKKYFQTDRPLSQVRPRLVSEKYHPTLLPTEKRLGHKLDS